MLKRGMVLLFSIALLSAVTMPSAKADEMLGGFLGLEGGLEHAWANPNQGFFVLRVTGQGDDFMGLASRFFVVTGDFKVNLDNATTAGPIQNAWDRIGFDFRVIPFERVMDETLLSRYQIAPAQVSRDLALGEDFRVKLDVVGVSFGVDVGNGGGTRRAVENLGELANLLDFKVMPLLKASVSILGARFQKMYNHSVTAGIEFGTAEAVLGFFWPTGVLIGMDEIGVMGRVVGSVSSGLGWTPDGSVQGAIVHVDTEAYASLTAVVGRAVAEFTAGVRGRALKGGIEDGKVTPFIRISAGVQF